MSTETQKVDVLGNFDRRIRACRNREAECEREGDEFLREVYREGAEEAEADRAAVAELIDAAGLRVEWINGTWYVLTAGGAAWTNVGHATEGDARKEAAEALRDALVRIGGAS